MAERPTVADMMAAYAEDAVDHARANWGLDLDYSVDSVRSVEDALAKLHGDIPRGLVARLFRKGPSTEELTQMAMMYGGYLGEVLRKKAGGEWAFDLDIMPGSQVVALRKGDTRVFPPAKVHKRLVNGPEDNVWHYVQILRKDDWK
jgi:hypothetical protein